MANAVVTGGLGFIGSNLVDRLIEDEFDVTVIDDLSTGQKSNINNKAKIIYGSVTDKKLVNETLKDVEFVFHTAALPRIQPSFDEPIQHENVNVIGTINCLEAVKKNKNIKKFVFSASSSCYGNPEKYPTPESSQIISMNPYSIQKYAAEQFVLTMGERFDIPVLSLRYFNVYGPRSFNENNSQNAYSSVIGIFHNQFCKGLSLSVTGDGEQSRDFVHVYDVVDANIKSALSDINGEVFNVGNGIDYKVIDIAKMFSDNFHYIPKREGEAEITLADISKIKNQLGWLPKYKLKEGLETLSEGRK